jgi:hypothetical protein
MQDNRHAQNEPMQQTVLVRRQGQTQKNRRVNLPSGRYAYAQYQVKNPALVRRVATKTHPES